MTSIRFDLLRIPFVKWFVKRRWFQFAVTLPTLGVFVVLTLAGFFGTPVGSHNLSVLGVWLVWWGALMIVLVPVFGRMWCTICPMPAVGMWIQRGTLTRKRDKYFSLMKKWPKKLENIWLQNISFLAIATCIGILITRPAATAIMLILVVLVLPTALFLLYEKRVWCRYVCPVSGFIGLYAMASGLELRVKDQEVCLTHMGKECYKGSEAGYGCPWFEFPQNLDRNAYCGLCMECVKTCPRDNIALNLRLGGDDLLVEPWHGAKKRGFDEPFRVFIETGLSFLYVLVFVGPYAWIKVAADWLGGATLEGASSVRADVLVQTFYPARFLTFAGLVWGSTMVAMPLAFLAFAYISKQLSRAKGVSLKTVFINFSYSLVPLSLAAWVALSVYLLMINGSYVIAAVSDPFGWGWNLFGTAGLAWKPYLTQFSPDMQILVLLVGLVFSIRLAFKISLRIMPDKDSAVLAFLPMLAMLTGVCILYLGLWSGAFFWGWAL